MKPVALATEDEFSEAVGQRLLASARHRLDVEWDRRLQDEHGIYTLDLDADLAMADEMMGTATNATAFLKEVDDASRGISDKEYKLLLYYAQTRQPGITTIPASSTSATPRSHATTTRAALRLASAGRWAAARPR